MLLLKQAWWVFILFFALPLAAASVWWWQVDRPSSWRNADWGSTETLPAANQSREAAVHIMAARTGGFKGAFSVHSWIVIKERDAERYTRFDKVGWGRPVRVNAYAADANWYSNPPTIIKSVTGEKAEQLLPEIKQAIDNYPHSGRGDYQIWPGPNSNSFVAYVLRQVPEIGAVLPPNAVGRDYLAHNRWFSVDRDYRDFHLNIAGLIGVSAGVRSGIELHLLGQTAGLDLFRPAIKLPGIGRVGMSQ